MAKIKRIKSTNDPNFEHFLLNIFKEMPNSNDFFIELFHSLLPNRQKIITENYAAIEDKKILCEVSISPQSRKNARWHINHLAVGECSDEVLSRLIKYVMNKYGGDGVETFITFVDEKMPELKELFKKGCSFRECAHLELWQGNNTQADEESSTSEIFKDYNNKFLNQIVELHNNMIFPQFRQALKIDKEDFRRRIKGAIFKKVLYNESASSIEGYFLIFRKNNNLYLELLLSEAYATYYPEILNHCQEYLGETTILVKKYHTSSKILIENLAQQDFEKKESFAILVKDYWSPVKEKEASLLSLKMNVGSPA